RVDFISGGQTVPLWSFTGQAGDKLGVTLALVGDINGDGVADVAAGAIENSANGQNSGRVYVLSGANGQLIHTLSGLSPHGVFGHGFVGIGDVNGDGVGDIAVGQPYD